MSNPIEAKPELAVPLPSYERDSRGLIKDIQYIHNKDGSINWRAMIKSEHLFINKDYFQSKSLSIPASIEGLEDNQLLIKLSGIKELAKLRGYTEVSYSPIRSDNNYVSVKCGIKWIANFEHPYPVYFEDMANATSDNTSNFGTKFLETIAVNRAFVRAVRNFLNIHIVGSDEIDTSKNKIVDTTYQEATMPTASDLLIKALNKKKISSFEDFFLYLQELINKEHYHNDSYQSWKSFSDIPAKETRILVGIINKL